MIDLLLSAKKKPPSSSRGGGADLSLEKSWEGSIGKRRRSSLEKRGGGRKGPI